MSTDTKPAPAPIDIRKPLCTKRSKVKLIQRLADGRLIFLSEASGAIVTTDKFGCELTGQKRQLVYNGAPEDLRWYKPKVEFTIGEAVFVIRVFSSVRRVFAAIVVGSEPAGVLVQIPDRSGIKVLKSKQRDNGAVLVPRTCVLKSADDVRAFTGAINADLEAAIGAYNELQAAVANANATTEQ